MHLYQPRETGGRLFPTLQPGERVALDMPIEVTLGQGRTEARLRGATAKRAWIEVDTPIGGIGDRIFLVVPVREGTDAFSILNVGQVDAQTADEARHELQISDLIVHEKGRQGAWMRLLARHGRRVAPQAPPLS